MIKAGLIEDCACWNGPGFAEFIMGFVDDGSHYRQQIEVTFIWAIYFDYVKTVYPDYEYKRGNYV